jgi:uncharacterized membrane protein YdbT with pleckstrin-like domain
MLAAACPALAVQPETIRFNRPPARAQRRYILPLVWVTASVAAIAIVISALTSGGPWWGAPLLFLVPLAALLGLWQYRDAGWTFDGNDRLIVRGRTLGRSTAVTLRRRLQHYSVHRSLFQRPAHLATFGAAIASGGRGRVISVAHLDEGVAFAIANPSPGAAARVDDGGVPLPRASAHTYTDGKQHGMEHLECPSGRINQSGSRGNGSTDS